MELSGAESVHSLNHRSCVFNGSLRQDAVAKIENMSGTIARTTQNPLDPRFNDLNGSEKCHGVQVPLDSHIMTKKRPGISQIRAPIHPYNIATRLLHQGKERGVAGSKMDGRNLLVNALEYALAVRIHIFLVVRRAECSDPTVKQLHGLHPSLNLKVQVGDYRVRDLVHESVPNVRSPVHESLGIDIVLRPSTLDHVAGKGEWCTRKPNQRSAPLQFLPHPLDSLLEEWHMFLGLQRKERIHILYRAHGIAYDRTFSLAKDRSTPMPGRGNRMSAKMMAASRSNLLMGWRVTSAASSGVRHISKNVRSALRALYSSKYRPACLIIQTGVQSTSSLRQAFRNR